MKRFFVQQKKDDQIEQGFPTFCSHTHSQTACFADSESNDCIIIMSSLKTVQKYLYSIRN